MKRSGPPKRRKPLRSQSAKRRAERPARLNVIAEVIARDGPGCKGAAVWPEIECDGPLDADEYDLRSARPGGHLDPANVQLLCRAHHNAKHRHHLEAARRGLRPFPHSGDRDMRL